MNKLVPALAAAVICCAPARASNLRIVSVTPATTEIVCAIGAESELVGVTTLCDYPLSVKTKEKVGSFSEPNIEKIIQLRPDIVLATGLEQAEAVRKMRKIGLNVVSVEPDGFDGLFRSVRQVGKACDREKEASELVAKMQQSLEAIKEKADKANRRKGPRVYFEIWNDPLMTAGKGSFIDEMITAAGGVNIAQDAPRPYSQFSAELVVERDPDVIILGYMAAGGSAISSVGRRPGWAGIRAVREGRVYDDIDPDTLFRPGPRIIDGVKALNERFCK